MFLATYQKFYNLKFNQMDGTKETNVNKTSTKQHDAKLHTSGEKRKVCSLNRESLMCGIWLRSGHTCSLCQYFRQQT